MLALLSAHPTPPSLARRLGALRRLPSAGQAAGADSVTAAGPPLGPVPRGDPSRLCAL